jgi:SAM-dependent methyltransferase
MAKLFHGEGTEANRVLERFTFDYDRSAVESSEYREHVSRYIFALQFVINRITLDIACGTGYGVELLARFHPKILVGVDYSREAVVKSKKRSPVMNADVLIGDGAHLSFAEGTFDTVLSFETIEHLRNPERFLEEIRMVLKNDGVLVISTPNKAAFSGYDSFYGNKFHINEFTVLEFSSLLQKYFERVDLFGEIRQGIVYKTAREIRKTMAKKLKFDPLPIYSIINRLLNRSKRTDPIYPLKSSDKAVPKYLLAICRYQKSSRAE